MIARTLQGFAVGLPFFSAFQLITRTFYATQDSRTPALVNIGAAIVTVAVDVTLVSVVGWDVPALALGHALSYVFATTLGLALLRPKLGSLDGGRIAGTTARAVPAAAVTAAIAWLVAAGVGAVVDAQMVVWRLVQVGLAVVAGVGAPAVGRPGQGAEVVVAFGVELGNELACDRVPAGTHHLRIYRFQAALRTGQIKIHAASKAHLALNMCCMDPSRQFRQGHRCKF